MAFYKNSGWFLHSAIIHAPNFSSGNKLIIPACCLTTPTTLRGNMLSSPVTR